MPKTIIEENTELLNSLPALTGDAAKLAHRLSETTNRLATAKIVIEELLGKSANQVNIPLLKGLLES